MLRLALAALQARRRRPQSAEAVAPFARSRRRPPLYLCPLVRRPPGDDFGGHFAFLRFASPAPAAHDFTPALQGLPETKVKKNV